MTLHYNTQNDSAPDPLFYAIIPTLFLYFLPFCYPYILLRSFNILYYWFMSLFLAAGACLAEVCHHTVADICHHR